MNGLHNENRRPNVIILYADDLGFGDISCYGATKIPTPNIDRIAAQGLKFTNGYSSAATCTPARFSLLTGTYPWRNERAQILKGDAPLIIDPKTPTLPGMLRNAGYTTGIVGKWHLGLGNGNMDWNNEIKPGPMELGFDYSFIMPATNDRVPCVFVDGRHVAGLDPSDPIEVTYDSSKPFPGMPTGKDNPELLRMKPSNGHDCSIINGVSRIGHMRGGNAALWKDEEMAEVFLNKAISFVTENSEKPFFLYYAFHQPHVPRLPNSRFAGKTELGPRGDAIVELDWCVGGMLDALERLGLMENTIIVFSSDNGPVLDDGYVDQAVVLSGDHHPAGPYRGGKYSMYEGGTHIPFILSWKGTVEPGESKTIVCQMDLFASLADLVGQQLQPDAALDSLNILPAFMGESDSGRTELVKEGTTNKLILQQENWVYIPAYNGPAIQVKTNIELGNSPEIQLYNLNVDISQQRNEAKENPEIVERMSLRLREIIDCKATRPGAAV